MIKRKLKILGILCLCFIMTLGITRIPVSATKTSAKSYALTPENDFAIDSSGTITGYTGSSTTVNIPATINGIQVTAIGPSVFEHKSTTDVIIPNRVTRIDNYAFHDCISLKNVTLPEGLLNIGDSVFDNCIILENITIPKSVINIGTYAFRDCESLQSITIPEGVKETGEEIFKQCKSLKNVTLPKSLTKISDEMFYGCDALENIIIPENVTDIGVNAFYNCPVLKNINIPKHITSIADGTFSYCSGLESITIPDGVTSIGKDAFSNCRALKNIVLPKGVTNIGNNAFKSSGLKSITIPEGITSIGNGAFGYSAPFETQNQLNNVLIISDDPEHPDITHLELDKIDTQSNRSLNWYRGIVKPEINVKQSEIKSYTYEESEFYLTDIFEYKHITKIYQDKTGTTEYTGDDIIIPEQYLIPDPTYSIVGTPTSHDTKVENGKLYIGSDETATNLKVKIKFGTLEKETNINRIPLHSISMKTLPKSTYTDGEKYDPTGLVISIKYDDGKTIDIKYNDTTKSDFTFNVDKITLSTSKQIITYRGKIVEHILTVTAKPIDEPQTPETPNIDVPQNPEFPTNNKPQDIVNNPNNMNTSHKNINFHINRTENGIIYDEFGNRVDKYGNIIQTSDETSLLGYLSLIILSGCAVIIMKKKYLK